MYCPNCGTENNEKNKYCFKCGQQLSSSQGSGIVPEGQMPAYTKPTSRHNPLATPLTIGGLAGMVGGAMTVYGWFLPWSILGFGNGPQLIIGVLGAGVLGGGLADLGDVEELGILVLCLTLFVVGLILVVPIMGILAAIDGWRLFVRRTAGSESIIQSISEVNINGVRRRLSVVVIMMAITFIAVSFASTAVLGRGFWVTSIGALIGLLGALYGKAQMGYAMSTV